VTPDLRRLLERLAAGETVLVRETSPAPTIEALLALGYVEAVRFGRASTEFGITDAGREAVRAPRT
jgi:hypothetical protein